MSLFWLGCTSFPEREIFVGQITESDTDDIHNYITHRWPPMEHLVEKLQQNIVQHKVDQSHHQISDYLRSTSQIGTRKTDVTRHPETRQERDGKLQQKSCDMWRESDEAQIEDLSLEDKMV